jgi:hypothetical protein
MKAKWFALLCVLILLVLILPPVSMTATAQGDIYYVATDGSDETIRAPLAPPPTSEPTSARAMALA